MNEATSRFVRQHADDDVRMLALHGSKEPDVDMVLALQQIQGRQTARRKLPSWAALEGILFPPRLAMEQCSSEQAGRYKAEVAARWVGATGQEGLMADLTGGLGVDFSFLAPLFRQAVYVEQQEALCHIARQNFATLGLKGAQVVCGTAADELQRLPQASLIFLDPARRDSHGGRTYGMADCSPDVLSLRDALLAKARCVMLKLSPMLDWRQTVADLGKDMVREVHIVSVGGECKELLLVLSREGSGLRLVCENDGCRFEVREDSSISRSSSISSEGSLAGLFLHEPNASVMKAGCFSELCQQFGVSQLAQNSHLFLSSGPVEGFPGRSFKIDAVALMNKKALRQALQGLKKANITVRNFPLSVAELRKRLKIGEGGDAYLFATTLSDETHVILVCHKPDTHQFRKKK